MRLRNAAKALIVKGGHVLVVEYLDESGPWYILPGGGARPGETLTAALQRECVEELGCSVRINDLLFVREYISSNHAYFAEWARDVHHVDFIFACDVADEYDPESVRRNPAGIQNAVAWKSLDELAGLRFFPGQLLDVMRGRGTPVLPHYLGDVP